MPEKRSADQYTINYVERRALTPTDTYWGDHTVKSEPFETVAESERFLEWRFGLFPFFREFMALYGVHDNEVILEYGCGPGHDLIGFATKTKAKKIIGIDVSEKALNLVKYRLSVYGVNPEKIELYKASDANTTVPLEDGSVDYIHSLGVLHHTSDPLAIMKEFARILKNGGSGRIMVYNSDSLWMHLLVAYEKIILNNEYPGMTAHEAFPLTTDGNNCPVSRCYSEPEFIELCVDAGFTASYKGGYLSRHELDVFEKYFRHALDDKRLGEEHRKFLRNLRTDSNGLPLYKDKYCGFGGVYYIEKK